MTTSRRYRLKTDSTSRPDVKRGQTVYKFKGHDYGLSEGDTRMSGTEHVSVTVDPGGGPPYFTVPTYSLEELS